VVSPACPQDVALTDAWGAAGWLPAPR